MTWKEKDELRKKINTASSKQFLKMLKTPGLLHKIEEALKY